MSFQWTNRHRKGRSKKSWPVNPPQNISQSPGANRGFFFSLIRLHDVFISSGHESDATEGHPIDLFRGKLTCCRSKHRDQDMGFQRPRLSSSISVEKRLQS